MVAAVCIGGIVRGFTGFGSALIIIPALTLVFSPIQAVVMHSVMEVPVVLGLAPTAIRHADRSVALPMIAALIITTPIGAVVLSTIDADALKLMIAMAVLGMVSLLAFQRRVQVLLGRRGTIAGGALGGLIQGATGIGGPPIVTALMARGDEPVVSRGNVIAVMSSVISVSLVAFGLFGLITREVLVMGALASPFCLLATLSGMHAFKVFGGANHRSVTLVVLALTALETLAVVFANRF
jgi:uncharacterized membrane protein YfcA